MQRPSSSSGTRAPVTSPATGGHSNSRPASASSGRKSNTGSRPSSAASRPSASTAAASKPNGSGLATPGARPSISGTPGANKQGQLPLRPRPSALDNAAWDGGPQGSSATPGARPSITGGDAPTNKRGTLTTNASARRGTLNSTTGTPTISSSSSRPGFKRMGAKVFGDDIDARDKTFGWTQLLRVANDGNLRKVTILLKAKADVELRCNSGNNALHMAARQGHQGVVEYLLAQKVSLNTQNANGWTPLMWSAMNGHLNVASVLTEAGADLTFSDKEGLTSLMWAVRHGRTDIVRALLIAGDDLQRHDQAGRTAVDHAWNHLELRAHLMAAERVSRCLFDGVKQRDADIVVTALRAGAYVDSLDEDGWRPLMHAAFNGSLDLVHVLMAHGASPSLAKASLRQLDAIKKDNSDLSDGLCEALDANERLLAAAKTADWVTVMEALELCAWVNAYELPSRRTTLMFAAQHDAGKEIETLVDTGAVVEKRDVQGWTALHFAVAFGSVQALSTLHHVGADLNAKTYEGDNPLHVAVCTDDASMVQMLLACDGDVEQTGADGLTPLQTAAVKGCPATLRVLIAYKADATIKDDQQRSPLALAALGGHAAALQTLLEKPRAPPRLRCENLIDGKHKSNDSKSRDTKKSHGSKSRERDSDPEAASSCSPRSIKSGSVISTGSRQTIGSASVRSASSRKTVTTMGRSRTEPATTTAASLGRKRAETLVSGTLTNRRTLGRSSTKRLGRSGTKRLGSSDVLAPVPEGKEHLQMLATARAMREHVAKSLPAALGAPALSALDESGFSPLMHAASGAPNSDDVVRELLKFNAPTEVVDAQGNTPLMLAAQNGLGSVCTQLINAGAHSCKKNKDGKRAVDAAKNKATREVLEGPTLRAALGLGRSATDLTCTDTRPNVAKAKEGEPLMHRVRLEALPAELPVDLMQGHVRSLLRRLGAKDPERVDVPVNPITRVQMGHAYVEFRDASKVDALLRGDGDTLCGSTVRVVVES